MAGVAARPPASTAAARFAAVASVGVFAQLVDFGLSSLASGAASTTGRSKPISRRVPGRQLAQLARDDLGGFAHDLLAALPAERPPDAREQQPHVVVDLGRRADGRARVADAVLLPDGDRRRDAVDRSTSGFSIRSRNCRA